MDFHLNEEQLVLQETVNRFVKDECPSSFVRSMEESEKGYTQELWQKMAELGWMELLLPEEYDGIGLGLLDLVIIMEGIGSACLPGPYLSTVLGSLMILEGGSDAQKNELLPQIGGGDLVLTLACLDPGITRYEPAYVTTTAKKDGDGFVLSGVKLLVPDAESADYIIVSARTSGENLSKEGISLFLIPRKTAGVNLTPLKTVAGDKQFEVALDNVKVGQESLLGDIGKGWPILEKTVQTGAVAKCAEMVGGAKKVMDMTVEYTNDRVQFGSPIGRFQAVQHHCANMVIDLSGSRFITYKAAWMLGEGLPCDLAVASAKAWTSEAYKRICAIGHQIGAATAYIVDHDMTLYSRRAKAAELAYGDASYHRRQIASAIGL